MCNCGRSNFCIDETTLLIIIIVLFFVCGWGNCSGISTYDNCGGGCGNGCGNSCGNGCGC